MPSRKDPLTHTLRQEIMTNTTFLVETERADELLSTLTFQSLLQSNRHVWIDTDMRESVDAITIELEDWNVEETWDHTVAVIDTTDFAIACQVVVAWLRGDPLEACLNGCVGCRIEKKS